MRTEEQIRQEIFDRVKELYFLKKQKIRFSPGETPIPYAGRVYDECEMLALVDASLDFWLTAGRYAEQFERDFANFLGIKYCLLTNSGSSANLLAISALTSPKLGDKRLLPGDEVITTACGFPTTLNPIIQNNLLPVFLDIEIGSYNIQVAHIEEAITSRTKAIFVAHTLGNPVELDAILKLVNKYNLWLIEDNCDALGSQYRGQYTGTFGHIATTSFYPPHHITMGEGGAVLTNDPILKTIIASFRDWGRDCWCAPGQDNTCNNRFTQQFGNLPEGYDHKYVYSHIGYNLKVTDMQAAVGVEQLKKLPWFITARRENFVRLFEALRSYEDDFILPRYSPQAAPSWFGFPLLVRPEAKFSRNDIITHLESHRIATRMLFGGNLTKQPAYEQLSYRIASDLANTDLVMNNLFWFAIYPGLTEEMLLYIAQQFEAFLKNSVSENFYME